MNVDAHHHFWNPGREPQPWMTDEHAAINRAFEPSDLEPLLAACGVQRTVLVQAAATDLDTIAMFEHAARHDWIGGVVAWVPLDAPAHAGERLDELAAEPKLRGIRHLIHQEDDPHWILRPAVLEGIALLEQRGLVLELPCVFPDHLGDVPALAQRFPRLAIVIDHLGKPPLGTPELDRWAAQLWAAAASANVAAKVSGLNTVLPPGFWDARDLQPAVEVAYECFGPDRLLCGSDWPVALLNGSYEQVWTETVRAVETVAGDAAPLVLGGTADRLYRLTM